MSLYDIDFKLINQHGGSKNRAFEELGFQLLAASIDRNSWQVTRTGDPDAGLDWYATNSEGEVHGWQAKYIFDIEALLNKMTDSVKTIIGKRPDVTEITFVIPWNLPDGQPRTGKSARQKYNDKVRSWQTMDGAENLRFQLIGESELLEILFRPEHRGRLRFFWGKQTLSHGHLIRLQEKAVQVAGRRYRPNLHVDIPIQKEIDALGLGHDFFMEINEQLVLLDDVTEDLRSLSRHPHKISEDNQNIINACQKTIDEGYRWAEDTYNISKNTDRFRHTVKQTYEILRSIHDAILKASKELQDKAADDQQGNSKVEHSQDRTFWYRRIITPITDLFNSLTSTRSHLIEGIPYFLVGDAGTGKTHLLLDTCCRALQQHRPAVVLFGEQFGTDDLWSQLARGLGLSPDLPQNELLGILDACGAQSGGRFLLIIDALNETRSPSFWSSNLIPLVTALRDYSHVSLAVSVRSTYIEKIDPDERREEFFITKNHPGFAGIEIEATGLYFNHYELELPRHPLLTPEFTNPLFLQLYCEGFKDCPEEQRFYETRMSLFNRLIDSRVRMVANQLVESGSSTEISLLIDDAKIIITAILDTMGNQGRDLLPLQTSMESIISSGIREDRARKLLTRLEAEGVFSKVEIRSSDSYQLSLRFTFQELGDYLILDRRLKCRNLEQDIIEDRSFATWLINSSLGIYEAAAVILPEQYGIELRDYLEPMICEIDDDSRRKRHRSLLDRFTLRTLAFRSSASITEQTLNAINRAWTSGMVRTVEFYNQLCKVAAIPDHPLNAHRLHRHLSQMSMADRDASFGIAVYNTLEEDDSFWRLAVWAKNGPYINYDETVVELASIPLVWLLSSPNRFMRDWLTKILISLFIGHIEALSRVIKLFATVNDDYIKERLLAVVYGILMRSQNSIDHNRNCLRELVIETCTGYLKNPIANALALDHLEGIVEYSLVYQIVELYEVPNHKIPYGLPSPDYPWTMEYIDRNYNYKEDDGFPYGSFYISLFNMGDFGRYGVDHCFGKFTKIRRTEPAPSEQLRFSDQISYPTDRACRWIFMRSIKYGWTPERFRQFERSLRYGYHSYNTRKPERFGKKYQWMAYYELLARVRDHFHPYPSWSSDDSRTNFEGLWQSGDRDLDPSVPPTYDFRELIENSKAKGPTFSQPEITVSLEKLSDHDLERYLRDSENNPIRDYDTLPKPREVLEVSDQSDQTWLLLTAFGKTQINDPDHRMGISLGRRTLILDQATIIVTYLVPKDEALSAAQRALDSGAELRPHCDGMWEHSHDHIDCCYLGEIGWRDQGCYSRQADFMTTSARNAIHRFFPVVEEYMWEAGRYDTSVTDTMKVYAPSAWIISKGCLSWDGNLSWLDQDGRIVVTNSGLYGFTQPRGLIFLKSWFLKILTDNDLALLVRCWSERRDFRTEPSRLLRSSSIALFDQSYNLLFEDRVNKTSD